MVKREDEMRRWNKEVRKGGIGERWKLEYEEGRLWRRKNIKKEDYEEGRIWRSKNMKK